MQAGKLAGPEEITAEIGRITGLIRASVQPDEQAFVLVSGGIDSDVTARLGAAALSAERLRLATVIQDDMEERHLDNARGLAKDLGVTLVEIDLRGINTEIVYRLGAADPAEGFDPLGLIDPARMKCSLRTVLLSSYQDRGYVVLGTSNQTESQLGFFLPFGDGIWHVGPIAHLYKTEVRLIGEQLGTAPAVQDQPPSAGFWKGETDGEDMGFWLVNRAPIQRERDFSPEEERQAAELTRRLDEKVIDTLLLGIAEGEDIRNSPLAAGLGADLVDALTAIVERSSRLKNRPIGVALGR
jgi:NAD+ synthase